MEYFNDNIFGKFNFQQDEQNTDEQINEIEKQLEIMFPKEYRSILKEYNGVSGEIGEYYIDLWSIEDIIDFYEDTNGDELKDLVLFASDGCGMAYAFRKSNIEIRIIPMDSLEYKYSKTCSEGFCELIQDMYLGKLRKY